MTNIAFKQAHSGNYRRAARGKPDIRYLVIHFTANDGDTAKNNADYFARAEISTSAHYFVDENEVWQSVCDADIAWHCGTRGTYFHPYCRNANSIGIELLMHFRSKKKTAREVSLYEPIGTDKEGNQIHLLDIVESDEPDVVETIETDRRTREVLALVPKLLSGRERYIIENRYGLYACKPMTQREIAAALGISRSYVSRIEKRALEKLRKGMESAGGGR